MSKEDIKINALLNGYSPQACAALYSSQNYWELLNKVSHYLGSEDRRMLDRALWVAYIAHEGQKRKNGDPYINHPLEVALIIADFCLDGQSLCTAILHDTIEDTFITHDDIKAYFGEHVCGMVSGVTKLDHLELQSRSTKQAENFRKLILAVVKDIRVLVIKLADRLHNMRTLHFIGNQAKRARIARETLDIYVPLAECIGMERIKKELEEIAFHELHPQEDQEIKQKLAELHGRNTNFAEKVRRALLKACYQEGVTDANVTWREKTPYSIWKKMKSRHTSFEQLSDVTAFRIIVDNVAECYKILGAIHSMWRVIPGRFKDYISTPKENGYQSIHTGVITQFYPYQKVEIQIRTRHMHDVAQNGVAAHWAYKTGSDLKKQHENYLPSARWLHSILEIMEASNAPDEFLENTKLQLYPDKVFCFSPKGEIYPLPVGATPVDFAYAVHGQVGDHCVGAKVNGCMVSLRHQLSNGEQVEILTEKGHHPSPSWERFVVTGKARAHIRKYIHAEERLQVFNKGQDIIREILHEQGFVHDDVPKKVEELVRMLHYASVRSLYYDVGRRRLTREKIEKLLVKEDEYSHHTIEDDYHSYLNNQKKKHDSDTLSPPSGQVILGIDKDIAVHYASCCHPLPGDPIVGLIHTGKYVSIHRRQCRQLKNNKRKDSATCLDLKWNEDFKPRRGKEDHKEHGWDGCMRLLMKDDGEVLSHIVNSLSKEHSRMLNLTVTARDDEWASVLLDVKVSNAQHMQNLMGQLRSVTGVHSVERAGI